MTTVDQQRVDTIKKMAANNGFEPWHSSIAFLLSLIAMQKKELADKQAIIASEAEDWSECHTFLQNAGIQMDPTDSYSGAAALIDGIKEVVAQRDQALSKLQDIGPTVDGLEVVRNLYQRERDQTRAALRKFGRCDRDCHSRRPSGGACTCGFAAALESGPR